MNISHRLSSKAKTLVSTASSYPDTLPDPNDAVNVTHVQLKPVLCCSATHNCELCLQIIITVQEVAVSEESGHYNDEEEVFDTSQDTEGSGQFMLPKPKGIISQKHKSSCVHLFYITSMNISSFICLSVCSMKLEETVSECDAPSLRAETDHKTNVILLQLEGTDASQDELMCQMVWNEMPGEVLTVYSYQSVAPKSILHTPGKLFVWWKKKSLQRKFCPFKNQQDALERMQHNVSITVVESPLRDGGIGLNWNVTAPCRLDAEVWLCNKDLAGRQCEEVKGSRQILQSNIDAGWRATRKGYWVRTSLCLKHPHIFSAFLLGYVWKWLKEDDVKGAVGGGHVLLLYSPDDNQALPELMCHLASSLQALGFNVSLDLWSQSELSILGPVPWLHSRLDQLKRQGGKVVLVLTQAAWIRAEQWGAQSWERNTPTEGNRGGNEEAGRSYPSKPCVDVFSASLSCILADYLQGRVGERFMLVQFESLPPEPPGGFRPLPELFRGLHVYSLPSQSLGFLTELAGARQVSTALARRKRAGGLRMASRALAKGLSGFTSGTNVLRLAGVSQSCVGVGGEDSGETVPLQLCLITPPSSPDTNPKVREKEWV
uniref:SEFIR domain-containing protein n=1 Tax=Mastacembelus armatus TaxID=205130 RepID=A0A3Q3N7J9_9TELE